MWVQTNESDTWYYTVAVNEEQLKTLWTVMKVSSIDWFLLWRIPRNDEVGFIHLTLDTKSKVDELLCLWLKIKGVLKKEFTSRESYGII